MSIPARATVPAARVQITRAGHDMRFLSVPHGIVIVEQLELAFAIAEFAAMRRFSRLDA
jgi:hypothetical protein